MMMAIGLFVFSLETAAYQEFERKTQWRYGRNQRVGARDAYQFTGEGDDTFTLTGWLAPELIGTALSLDALRSMADTGKSWILIKGTGRVYGTYIITEVTERGSILGANGDPKRIDFTINLERTDEGLLSVLGGLGDIGSISQLADMAGLGNIANTARDTVNTITNLSNRFL